MVKVIVAVLVLAGLGLVIAYYAGGAGSFDPTEQGRQAKAAITWGMTWQQVIDAAGNPQEFQTIIEEKRKDFTTYHRATPRKFKRDSLALELANDAHPHGFVFTYNFSGQCRFSVEFDVKGTVVSVREEATLADLLDTRN